MGDSRTIDLNDIAAVVRAALATRASWREVDGLALLQSVLARRPAEPLIFQSIGLLERARLNSGPARAAFAEAARLAPGDARIAHGLARVTLEAGLPAVALFERARVLAPADGDVLLGLGAALVAEGRHAEAVAMFEATLAVSPRWAAGHRACAELLWSMGRQDSATDMFHSALALAADDAGLWSALIDFTEKTSGYERAGDLLDKARTVLGDQVWLRQTEAICVSEGGDHDRAGRLFASLEGEWETSFAVRHLRHLLRTGRAGEAASRAEALTGRPDAGQVWPYLATAWRLTGDPRAQWLEREDLIASFDLADAIDLPVLAARLKALHNMKEEPVGQSVRGGTQTDGPLLARVDPEIRALRSVIEQAVMRHVRALGPPVPGHPVLGAIPPEVRFAGSWSVWLRGGAGHHVRHIHPEGWYSSALYVELPSEAELGEPPSGWLSLGQPPAELGIDLPPLRRIEPKPGRLALFPSIMWHGTEPFASGRRLTVAFDVAPPPAG